MSKPSALFGALVLAGLTLLSCASPEPRESRDEQRGRIERARQGIEDDPLVEARLAAIDAARASEEQPMFVDEVELRVGDEYIDEHQVRVSARLPMNRPSELRAQREVLAAETRIAISRLEETSLERRRELCLPSIETLAAESRREIYADYAERQRGLIAWNADWRSAGTIDELRAASFDLERRIRLASWEPKPVREPSSLVATLPEIGSPAGALVRDAELLRATIHRYHPSVTLRRATAERYRALAQRAQARNQPWLKFVEVGYEHRTDKSENGVGGRLAFEIPLGGERASVGRYEALVRQESGEARGFVEEQMGRSLQALEELHHFESRSERWLDLLRLTDQAEEIADRWWRERLAKPTDVAALLDEAFAARNAVLEARERAGGAYCILLAMTGVDPAAWPREAVPQPTSAED
jgi:hypothetical protein